MPRFIHTGDTHIGYRQYHSPERRRDFLRAFRQVVDDAVETDVDAVVHAGDLFHDRRPGLVDLQGTVDILRDLRAADIPFLAVVGNHEGKRDAQWLDLFEDLDLATRLGDAPYHLDENTAIYGLDYVPRSCRADLTYEFESTDADHRVLVSHGLFEPFPHGTWDTERLLSDATVDFDLLLLGDDHTPARKRLNGTVLTYCGSTERTSASEREDRGYNIVTLADGDITVSRRGIDAAREFVFVDVTLAAGEGQDRVRDAVQEHDLTDAVVIVTIEGAGEPVTPASIEELAVDRGALVARVNDRRAVEAPETGTHQVSFADPDEAVRERLSAMELSSAALAIDETVRSSPVADSNVRGAVEDQVRDGLEDLVAADVGDPSDQDAGDARDPAEFVDVAGATEADGGIPETTRDADTDTDTDTDADADDRAGSDTQSDGDTEDDLDQVGPAGEEGTEGPDGETAAADGQVSMEEFL